MKQLDLNAIRIQNLNRIVDSLQRDGSVTRKQISQKTQLSLMTVTKLVDQLKNNHAITLSPQTEQTSREKTYGRIAENVQLDACSNRWFVINLMDRYFQYILMGIDRAICQKSNPWAYSHKQSYNANLKAFLEECSRFLIKQTANILGIAVIVPGPYNADKDTVNNMRIPELGHIHLKQMLRKQFGQIDIFVDEDVKFAVRAYAKLYFQVPSLYYLYIGEGVGGVLSQEGRIRQSLNTIAGDPGQIPSKNGKTFEQLLCLNAFRQRMKHIVPGNDLALSSPNSFCVMMAADPEAYRQEIASVAEDVVDLLFLVVWMLDPHGIVIDCPYTRPVEDEFNQLLHDGLRERLSYASLPTIYPCLPEIEASYFGAAEALKKYWIETME